MDSAYVPALAASAVGGLTSLMATWLGQRGKDVARTLAQERTRKQKLYKKFISEASKLYADALVHDNSEVSALVNLYTLIGRMRISSSDAVIGKAEAAARMIIDTYFSPNKTFPELRQLMDSRSMDPLREFGEVCRKELIALK
jgi:glycogen debranching enzyme